MMSTCLSLLSLDMLSAILTKTKQTLARDATLRAFDEVIMDIFDVRNG